MLTVLKAVAGALVLLVLLLLCSGLSVCAVRPDLSWYDARVKDLSELDTGDLLFFAPYLGLRSVVGSLGHLLVRGTIGTIYSHAGVVYKDLHGDFGARDALYVFEYDRERGGALLYNLIPRVKKRLGRVLCREMKRPSAVPMDTERLRKFVLAETERTLRREPPGWSTHTAWMTTVLQRHMLFLCPDPRQSSTCADYVMLFFEAAGLWRPDEQCFCTSVTDMQATEHGPDGLPRFEAPERIVFIPERRIQNWRSCSGASFRTAPRSLRLAPMRLRTSSAP